MKLTDAFARAKAATKAAKKRAKKEKDIPPDLFEEEFEGDGSSMEAYVLVANTLLEECYRVLDHHSAKKGNKVNKGDRREMETLATDIHKYFTTFDAMEEL